MQDWDDLLVKNPAEDDPEEDAVFSLGIDPGWKNLGMSLVKQVGDKRRIVKTWTINPSERGIAETVEFMLNEVAFELRYMRFLNSVVIERYVSYNNILTTEAENIVSLIGALQYGFRGSKVLLFRAIDWKVNLVKSLVKKHGFNNPSSKLDKKFSVAAAKACLTDEYEFPNDHEADATCLASYPFIVT